MSAFVKILKARKPKTRYKVIREISERWSPRYFSDKPVITNHLKIIFEAARWTPSGHNHQPWYYYYTKKGSPAYKKLFPTLNAYNQSWAKTAPVLILACAIKSNPKGENPFAFYDLGASVFSLVLQAQSLGYHARQIGLFEKEKVKKIFRLGKELEPFVIIALGKIGDYKAAPEEIIEMELDPRPRKTDFTRKL